MFIRCQHGTPISIYTLVIFFFLVPTLHCYFPSSKAGRINQVSLQNDLSDSSKGQTKRGTPFR
uniref:Uncharacterized protein n=1 Tax=Arundo donax TaxID=35708 RepID=A0A0A9A159_ARUDO